MLLVITKPYVWFSIIDKGEHCKSHVLRNCALSASDSHLKSGKKRVSLSIQFSVTNKRLGVATLVVPKRETSCRWINLQFNRELMPV